MINLAKRFFTFISFKSEFYFKIVKFHLINEETTLDFTPNEGIFSILNCIQNDDPSHFRRNLESQLLEIESEEEKTNTFFTVLLSIKKHKAHSIILHLPFDVLKNLKTKNPFLIEFFNEFISKTIDLPDESWIKRFSSEECLQIPCFLITDFKKRSIDNFTRITDFSRSEDQVKFNRNLFFRILPLLPQKKHYLPLIFFDFYFEEVPYVLLKFIDQTEDYDLAIKYINEVSSVHKFKAKEICFIFFSALQERFPKSILIKEIIEKEAIVQLSTQDLPERFKKETWKELYPNITNRALKKKVIPFLFSKKNFTFRFSQFEPFDRTEFHELGFYYLDKIFENKEIDQQWFLNCSEDVLNKEIQNLYVFLNDFKKRNPLFLKNTIQSWCERKIDSLTLIRISSICARHDVDKEAFPNTISVKEFKNLLIKHFENNPNIPLDQDIVKEYDGTLLCSEKEALTVSVPKTSGDLLRASKIMNNCLHQGYTEHIRRKKSYILFLKENDEIKYCLELYDLKADILSRKSNKTGSVDDYSKVDKRFDFYLIQAKGYKNQNLRAETLNSICLFFNAARERSSL